MMECLVSTCTNPSRRARRGRGLAIILLVLVSALSWSFGARADQPPVPDHVVAEFGEPPLVPKGPIADPLAGAITTALIDGVTEAKWGPDQRRALDLIASSKDPRLAWIIADATRYAWDRERYEAQTEVAAALLGIEYRGLDRWALLTNHLIAWDIPSYPGYLADKRAIFTHFGRGWDRLFVDGEIDWRHVSWGGVAIDDRPFGDTDARCPCIPAVDDPAVTSAAEATWLKDDDIVFGVTVNGESRAYPRRIMEVREMVNDTLGGRHLGIPYCTLCGAAQAYFTDSMPDGVERPILRTSGLLIRSNKVMYDVVTYSVFDTFLGTAVTGPLAEKELKLEQATVVTTDWGTWKNWYPETTVLAEGLALGKDYDFRNTRDANGPIFPVGDVDPRLPEHEDIVGVLSPSGEAIAFQRSAAAAALRQGRDVGVAGVRLKLDAGGVRAVDGEGAALPSHQAFWFAWSQFHPGTTLWPELD